MDRETIEWSFYPSKGTFFSNLLMGLFLDLRNSKNLAFRCVSLPSQIGKISINFVDVAGTHHTSIDESMKQESIV